jgi:hypothetical protein
MHKVSPFLKDTEIYLIHKKSFLAVASVFPFNVSFTLVVCVLVLLFSLYIVKPGSHLLYFQPPPPLTIFYVLYFDLSLDLLLPSAVLVYSASLVRIRGVGTSLSG